MDNLMRARMHFEAVSRSTDTVESIHSIANGLMLISDEIAVLHGNVDELDGRIGELEGLVQLID